MDWLAKKFNKPYLGEAGSRIIRGKDEDRVTWWFRDLEKYAYGKYSYAAITVREDVNREDYSQIVPGPKAAFVGVFDGHNGHEAAKFVSENLYKTLLRRIKNNEIRTDDIQFAVGETERGFLEKVVAEVPHPTMRTPLTIAGTSCLVGIIHDKQLTLANLGDSRAVLGSYIKRELPFRVIRGTQLTNDHSVESVTVRRSTDDRDIAVRRYGVWLYKGIPNLQTTRAIGDLYMKESRFNRAPSTSPFYVRNPRYPMIQSEPEMIGPRNIGLLDRFLVFASRGFWEQLTNEEVVDMVDSKPKKGIARRLIVSAMERAAEKRGRTYKEIMSIPAGEERKAIHEDMSVIVLYFDHTKFYKKPREDLCNVEAFKGFTRVGNFRF